MDSHASNSNAEQQQQAASYDSYVRSAYEQSILESLYRGEEIRATVIYDERILSLRPKLIWLIRHIYTLYHLHRSTMHLAIYILDFAISKLIIQSSEFELTAIVCIMAVAKMEGANTDLPTFAVLNAMVENRYSLQQYRNMEMAVLGVFNFRLMTPTVATFTDHYANVVLSLQDYIDYMHMHCKFQRTRLAAEINLPYFETYTDMASTLKKTLYAMVDVTLHTYTFGNTPPSMLASACMLAVRRMYILIPDWTNYMVHVTRYLESSLLAYVPHLIELYLKHAPAEFQSSIFEVEVRDMVIEALDNLTTSSEFVDENMQAFDINEHLAENSAPAVADNSRFPMPVFDEWVENVNQMYRDNSQVELSNSTNGSMAMPATILAASSTPLIHVQQSSTSAQALPFNDYESCPILRPAQPPAFVRSRSTQTSPPPPLPPPSLPHSSTVQQPNNETERRHHPANEQRRNGNIAMVAPRIRPQNSNTSTTTISQSFNNFTDSGIQRTLDFGMLAFQELNADTSAAYFTHPYVNPPPSPVVVFSLVTGNAQQASANVAAGQPSVMVSFNNHSHQQEEFYYDSVGDNYDDAGVAGVSGDQADNERAVTPPANVNMIQCPASNQVIIIDHDDDEHYDELEFRRLTGTVPSCSDERRPPLNQSSPNTTNNNNSTNNNNNSTNNNNNSTNNNNNSTNNNNNSTNNNNNSTNNNNNSIENNSNSNENNSNDNSRRF